MPLPTYLARAMVMRGIYASMETTIRSVTFANGFTDDFKSEWGALPQYVQQAWVTQANFIDIVTHSDAWIPSTDKEN